MSAGGGGGRLHFTMPAGTERFARFKDLPFDLRHKIWEELIYTPGIHFLKFERNKSRQRFSVDDEVIHGNMLGVGDESSSLQTARGSHVETPSSRVGKKYSAILEPIFPSPAADLSYYMTKSKTLTQLSLSCNEAELEVNRATSRVDNLTLNNGRLIALAKSSDIVCIDYPDLLHTRGLGSWATNLDNSQLTKIRRVAIRYHPSWDEERRRCRVCGRYHEAFPGSRKEQASRKHLYQFAALFPNLEAFYFIDHLIVRRPFLSEEEHADPRWLGPCDRARVIAELSASKGRSERFESGGRTYFEIDRQLCRVCKVHSHVFNMLEWVQESYIALNEEDGPRKHKTPTQVKFAVLACEWEQDKLVAVKKNPVVSSKRNRRKQYRRRAVAHDDPAILEAMIALKLESVYDGYVVPLDFPVIFGDAGQSTFEFTFGL